MGRGQGKATDLGNNRFDYFYSYRWSAVIEDHNGNARISRMGVREP